MNKIFQKSLQLIVIVLLSNSTYGQTKEVNLINKDLIFELKNDTLYSSTGLKIFVGQKLILGNASIVGGQYLSIISNKAAIVPSIWGQDMRYENAIENYVDSRKNKEKLRKFLVPGVQLTVRGISLSKAAKPHFYMVGLSSDAEECKADIKLALVVGELLLQP